LFAFRLAQKLDDAAASLHYVALCEQFGEDRMLAAFHRVGTVGRGERARRFHAELGALQDWYSAAEARSRFAAIRVERRAVAVVVMNGLELEYVQVRHLTSTADRALSSALGFVNRILEQFPFESAAVEVVPQSSDVQRARLTAGIVQTLREQSVGLWELTKQDLFACFGFPALHSRTELRDVVSRMWPYVKAGSDGPYVRDAAALGIYCQTERRFFDQ
jgi:hypothetical protein